MAIFYALKNVNMGQPKFVLSNTTQVYSIMFQPVHRPFSHTATQEHIEVDIRQIYRASSHIHCFYNVTVSRRMYNVQNTKLMSLLKMCIYDLLCY